MLQTVLAEKKSALPTLPREIAPGVFWFGCCLEVHEPTKILHNHNSCYLVMGSRATMLVDTGMPYGWAQLRREILSVLDGRKLDYIFPTHPEGPHMGNIGPLREEFPDVRLVGDLRNYHLYYPEAIDSFQTMRPGESLDLGGRRIIAVPAAIYDLPNTLWAYEPDQKIMFVSDAYPYTHEHEAHQCALTSVEMPGEIKPEDTSIVISRALGWVRYVDADIIMGRLNKLVETYPVDIIGPAHGAVVTNVPEITRVFEQGLRRVRL